MRIFGKVTINGIKGMVLVADTFIENESLKAQTMIEFDEILKPEIMEKLSSMKSEMTITVEGKHEVHEDIKVHGYSGCDYISGVNARVFISIDNMWEQLKAVDYQKDIMYKEIDEALYHNDEVRIDMFIDALFDNRLASVKKRKVF